MSLAAFEGGLLGEETRFVFGQWRDAFQPYFPEWRRNLATPQQSFRKGVFVFKVTLYRGVWRRIAIGAESDLDSLAWAILSAFDFDCDHLYQFIYQDRYGTTVHAVCPECQDRPVTAEVRIGDLPLEIGDAMIYNFDFGDDWRFEVKLERIDPPDRGLQHAALLKSHGEAPDQYPE